MKATPLKIAHVINSFSEGGAERLLVETLISYNNLGIKASAIYFKKYKGNTLLSYFEDLEHITLEPSINKNFYSPIHIIHLLKLLKNYDVVHVHLFPALYWVFFAHTLLTGKKPLLIFTEHNSTNKRRNKLLLNFIDRMVYGRYKKIVAVSDRSKVTLVDHLGPKFESRIKTIPNGINLEKIQNASPYSKTELGFKESDILLIQISRFRAPKDQNTIIQSLKLLPNHIKLLLVGTGEMLEVSMNLTSELDLNDRVRFLSTRDDVPKLLKSVDIVILSSKYEGLSLSSIEGMASGKPFIASDAPGLNEVVKDYGLLFPIGDSHKLASLIIKLVENNEFKDEVVEKCLLRAKNYDIRTMIDSYLEVYQNTISEYSL